MPAACSGLSYQCWCYGERFENCRGRALRRTFCVAGAGRCHTPLAASLAYEGRTWSEMLSCPAGRSPNSLLRRSMALAPHWLRAARHAPDNCRTGMVSQRGDRSLARSPAGRVTKRHQSLRTRFERLVRPCGVKIIMRSSFFAASSNRWACSCVIGTKRC